MLSRELTASVIKTFFEELSDVRDGGMNQPTAQPFAALYTSYFHLERDWFVRADVPEITTFLAEDPIAKLEMLTELMYQDARRATSAAVQAAMFRKIIELYDVIDTRSMAFSITRVNRVEELKKILNE